MSNFMDIPVIDAHTHIGSGLEGISTLSEIMNRCGYKYFTVLSVAGDGWSGVNNLAQNIGIMLFKAMYPDKVFGFGGLNHYYRDTPPEKLDFAAQAVRLINMGFDGMKMIEGKPGVRRELGMPLDSPAYDEYFAFMESKSLPILYHVADPEEFWDDKKIPDWARGAGWTYWQGGYPGNEDFYSEVEGFLKKFPRLNVIFAHFFFTSTNIEKAAEFLDKWPNIKYDITPGSEMYINFSKHPEKWHDFFTRYQDRILYGTDSVGGWHDREDDIRHGTGLKETVRNFLEKDIEHTNWDAALRGIKLDRSVLEKIYHKNFERYVGTAPKKLDVKLALEECERLLNIALENKDHIIDMASGFFKADFGIEDMALMVQKLREYA